MSEALLQWLQETEPRFYEQITLACDLFYLWHVERQIKKRDIRIEYSGLEHIVAKKKIFMPNHPLKEDTGIMMDLLNKIYDFREGEETSKYGVHVMKKDRYHPEESDPLIERYIAFIKNAAIRWYLGVVGGRPILRPKDNPDAGMRHAQNEVVLESVRRDVQRGISAIVFAEGTYCFEDIGDTPIGNFRTIQRMAYDRPFRNERGEIDTERKLDDTVHGHAVRLEYTGTPENPFEGPTLVHVSEGVPLTKPPGQLRRFVRDFWTG